MDIKDILRRVDHTLLRVDATENEIAAICDDALRYGCASVCIPCSYVAFAARRLGGRVPVCTTIGFPNGYSTAEVKVLETLDALKNGADEIDMVINVGLVKDKKYDLVLDEIKRVRAACEGKILKVIIETCLLSDAEIIELCGVVGRSGADYIKTSTGFSTAGATREAVALMRKHSPEGLKIKAAGGIKTLEDAEAFIALGADRLGTSRIVALVKQAEAE